MKKLRWVSAFLAILASSAASRAQDAEVKSYYFDKYTPPKGYIPRYEMPDFDRCICFRHGFWSMFAVYSICGDERSKEIRLLSKTVKRP